MVVIIYSIHLLNRIFPPKSFNTSSTEENQNPYQSKKEDTEEGLQKGGDEGEDDSSEFRGELLKFERVNAHLANERTWLAWIRTALSALTCAFSFMTLSSDSLSLS